MNRGKGFDRLRLAAAVVTAAGSLFGAARSARAGTGATVNQAGAIWGIFNSGSGPGTAPFLTATCGGSKLNDKQALAPAGTGSGCAMNITDARIVAPLQSDAFDGFFLMAVNGTQYRDPDGGF